MYTNELPDKTDPLATSFIVEGFNPFEPRPNQNPQNFNSKYQNLLNSFNNWRLTETMADPAPQTGLIREVKLNPPKPFTGKRTELKRFLQDVIVYVTIN